MQRKLVKSIPNYYFRMNHRGYILMGVMDIPHDYVFVLAESKFAKKLIGLNSTAWNKLEVFNQIDYTYKVRNYI